MFQIFFLFLFTALIRNTFSSRPLCTPCGPLEVFVECASPCTPEPTCENRFPIPPPICILSCEARCECDASRGLIREKESGKCINVADCPGKCGPLEVFKECPSPCVPERTCQNPFPISPPVCVLSCDPRCECDAGRGLIRDKETGKCIHVKDCLKICSHLEVFNECASPCIPERTCQYRYPVHPPACILRCDQRCECDASQGLIRDEQSGKCIKETHCPDECDANEFVGCRPCCEEATCDEPDPEPCTKPCPRICIIDCLCNEDEGYVRDTETGKCILKWSCPQIEPE